VEIVSCTDEADEQVSLDIYNEVWPHDRIGLAEVHSYKAGVVAYADLIVRIEGVAAGSAFAAIQPQRPELVVALVTVLAAQRRRGGGTALYEAISAWTREQELDELEAVVALDVTGIEPPQVEPPPGVEIVTWAERPDVARGIYEVAVEASPDVPGWEDELMEPFEDWLAHEMTGPGDLPEATFVAVAGDEVIGYAKLSLTRAQPTTAHHDLTGVKRAWRGRGVARALKASQIGWAKANGYEELRTRNDERNAPILKLNNDFGYRPTIGRIYLKGPLA